MKKKFFYLIMAAGTLAMQNQVFAANFAQQQQQQRLEDRNRIAQLTQELNAARQERDALRQERDALSYALGEEHYRRQNLRIDIRTVQNERDAQRNRADLLQQRVEAQQLLIAPVPGVENLQMPHVAEAAQRNAGEERDRAVQAQRNAGEERDRAVQAQRNAERERDQAVADRQRAETARDQAVQAWQDAERERDQAVADRQRAETARDRAVQAWQYAGRERDQAVQARQDAETARDRAQTDRDISRYLAGYDPYKFSHIAIVDPHLADLSRNLNNAARLLYTDARLHEQGDAPIDGTVFIAALENYMRYVKDDKHVVAGAQLEAGENGQVIIPAQVEDHEDSLMHLYRPNFEPGIIPGANYFWENAFRDAIREHADAALRALQQNAALRATNHPWSRVNLQAEDVRLSDVACVAAYNILVRAENAVANGEAAVDRNVQIDYICSEVVKAASVKIGNFEIGDFDQVYKDAKSAAPVILDAMAQYRQNPDNARHLAPKSDFFTQLMYFMYYTAQNAQREKEAQAQGEENGWTPLRIQSVLKCLDEVNGLEAPEAEE